MKELLIHIGQPKTGTSALQTFLACNRSLLRKHGIYYPVFSEEYTVREKNIGMGGNAGGLRKLGVAFSELSRAQIAYIQQMIGMFKYDEKVLLSDEVLWLVDPLLFRNIRALLETELDVRIKIIVYLRRQDERLESSWNQHVKRLYYQGTCREFCMGAGSHEWDYYTQLKKISEVIGKENMIVKIYDMEHISNGNNIFSDFMSIFGIENISDFQRPEFQVNPSLGKDMVEIIQILNSIPSVGILDDEFRKIQKENISFAKNTEMITKAPAFLTYDDRKMILDRCEQGNIKIGQEFFGIDHSPFPMLQNEQEKSSGEGINRDVIYFFGKILVDQAKEIEKLHWRVDEFALPEKVKPGSKVILYGADRHGCRVYHSIERMKRYHIVGFVDKRWERLIHTESNVKDPMMIFETDFDYILIGVGPRDTAYGIQEWLKLQGVAADKIVRVESSDYPTYRL